MPFMYVNAAMDQVSRYGTGSSNGYKLAGEGDKVLWIVDGGSHFEPKDDPPAANREDQPIALFFACHVREEHCDEVYGAAGDAICHNNGTKMSACSTHRKGQSEVSTPIPEVAALDPDQVCLPPLKLCGNNCQYGPTCASGYNLSEVDLCDTAGFENCSAQHVNASSSAFAESPAYSWVIDSVIGAATSKPTWSADVEISHPHKAYHGLNVPFGIDSGSACGANIRMKLGTGQKGNKSPVYCPECGVALQFPPCPWPAGSKLHIQVDFTMNYFILPDYDMLNTTIKINGDDGELLLAARSLADIVTA